MAYRVFEIRHEYFFSTPNLHHLWNKVELTLDTHHLIESRYNVLSGTKCFFNNSFFIWEMEFGLERIALFLTRLRKGMDVGLRICGVMRFLYRLPVRSL